MAVTFESDVLLTFSESKHAMTLPFSTWQLLAGCANLHSTSEREHVPRWNSRHTSSVSHFVSRMWAIFIAISTRFSGKQTSIPNIPKCFGCACVCPFKNVPLLLRSLSSSFLVDTHQAKAKWTKTVAARKKRTAVMDPKAKILESDWLIQQCPLQLYVFV